MGINIEQLKDFFEGDEEFLAELMDNFIQNTPEAIQKIKQGAEEENWNQVRAVSHKLASSTKVFQFNKISEQLAKLEDNAESRENLENIPELVKQLEAESDKIIEEMKIARQQMEF